MGPPAPLSFALLLAGPGSSAPSGRQPLPGDLQFPFAIGGFPGEIIRLYLKRVYQDPLTAIPNRQALDDRLHGLSGQYAIAMVDIDHFKKFNDTYGHAEGDNVLRMVAQHLMGHLGRDIYRYGGEEFCVVFEGEKREEAETRMELARGTLEKRKFFLGARGGGRTRKRKPH